jgi:hypothetical protein
MSLLHMIQFAPSAPLRRLRCPMIPQIVDMRLCGHVGSWSTVSKAPESAAPGPTRYVLFPQHQGPPRDSYRPNNVVSNIGITDTSHPLPRTIPS